MPSADLNTSDAGASTEPTFILTPDEALEVFTNPEEERFGGAKDAPVLLEKRAEVMRWEDAALKKHIEKHQLARWAQAAVEHADRTVRFNGDAVTNGNGSANGKSKQTNGHALASVEGEDDDEDEIA